MLYAWEHGRTYVIHVPTSVIYVPFKMYLISWNKENSHRAIFYRLNVGKVLIIKPSFIEMLIRPAPHLVWPRMTSAWMSLAVTKDIHALPPHIRPERFSFSPHGLQMDFTVTASASTRICLLTCCRHWRICLQLRKMPRQIARADDIHQGLKKLIINS